MSTETESPQQRTVARALAAVARRWNGYNAEPDAVYAAMAATLDGDGLLMSAETAAEIKQLLAARLVEQVWYRHKSRMERRERARADRLLGELRDSQELTAAMHAASVGCSRVPLLGFVADVAETRAAYLAQQHRADELDVIAKRALSETAELKSRMAMATTTIQGWSTRCRAAEAERDALRVRNAEVEARAAAGPGATWFLAENEGGLPTLHATLDAAQEWGVAELSAESPDRPVDWFKEDGLHFLRFVHPDDDRPLHRTTVSVVPLTVEGAVLAGELTVFRASYPESGTTLGTYRTRPAAMDHVHHVLAREENTTAQAIELRVIWRADDPDADESVWECWLHDEDGADDKPTGYVVGPVPIAAAYDPAGEE